MPKQRLPVFSIASVLILTFLVALAISLPQQLAGSELHRTTILWFVTCHQIFIAFIVGVIIWIILGRRLPVAIILALIIALLWGPNLFATIEYTATGKNDNMRAWAVHLGVAPYLNAFYSRLYDLIGYDFIPLKR